MWMHLCLKMDSLIKCFLFSNVFLFLGHWWRTEAVTGMNAGQWGEWHFPPNRCNSGFKGGRCPGCCKDVKVTWHTAKNGDLYSEFVLCIYPILSAHTPWTHTRSSGQPFMPRRPGSSWGFGALLKGTSVVVLRVERALYIHSPTYNSCRQPLGYESDSLTIRPRLPPCHMLCWWGFFMTTSIMLKRSWKLAVMHDLYSWTMKQTVSV